MWGAAGRRLQAPRPSWHRHVLYLAGGGEGRGAQSGHQSLLVTHQSTAKSANWPPVPEGGSQDGPAQPGALCCQLGTQQAGPAVSLGGPHRHGGAWGPSSGRTAEDMAAAKHAAPSGTQVAPGRPASLTFPSGPFTSSLASLGLASRTEG